MKNLTNYSVKTKQILSKLSKKDAEKFIDMSVLKYADSIEGKAVLEFLGVTLKTEIKKEEKVNIKNIMGDFIRE